MIRIAPNFDRVICLVLLGLLFAPSASLAQDNNPVRVRLMRNFSPRTIIISGNQSVELFAGDPTNPIQQLNAREKLTITTSNNQVYLRSSSGSIYARSLIVTQPSNAEVTIELVEAQTIPPPRTYRGAFMIQVDPSTPSTLNIINLVNMEDYVAGVLASEFNFPQLEAAKAIAVSIRTMAYRALQQQNGPLYAVPDDELWQVYEGTGPITRTVLEAVANTRGEVLRYNGELIEAVYFASSGGHTANNEDVWHAAEIKPYLRGRQDPYDYNSPHHTWESTISRERLLNLLSDRYKFRVTGIRVGDRSRDGRARTILLTGTENRQERIYSNDFRLLVTEHFGRESLKSTFFEINVQPNLFIFTGKGYGHGVGLNQWGALELSRKGNLYGEILAYYYNGIQLNDGGFYTPLVESASPTAFYYDNEPIAYTAASDNMFIHDSAQRTAEGGGATAGIESTLFGNESLEGEQAPLRADEEAMEAQANRGTREVFGWVAPINRPERPRSRRIGW